MLPVPDLYFYADRASVRACRGVGNLWELSAAHHDSIGHICEVAAVNEAMLVIEDDNSTF